jgi:hypothetical protein
MRLPIPALRAVLLVPSALRAALLVPMALVRAALLVPLALALPTLPPTALAADQAEQTPQDALLRTLSLLTGGWIDPLDPANAVTIVGDNATIGMPISGTTSTMTATLKRSGDNAWDLLSVLMPDSLGTSDGPDTSRQVVISQQQTHGRLDPTLGTPSALHATLKGVTSGVVRGATHATTSASAVTIESRLDPATDGRTEVHGTTVATDIAVKVNGAKGAAGDLQIPRLQGISTAYGVDPAQFAHLVHAVARMRDAANAGAGDAADVLEALAPALDHASASQQADSAKFTLAGGTAGSIGPSRIGFEVAARSGHLTAGSEITVEGLAIASATASATPAALHDFIPHHIAVRDRVTDLPIAPLVALLRDGAAATTDRTAARQAMLRYVLTSGATLFIDTLDFDTGPVTVHGSGRVSAAASGEPAMTFDVRATGVDALLGQAQSNAALQQFVPMIFIAKGMARQDGAALLWHIAVEHGALTVNGVPLGHPPGLSPPGMSSPGMSPPGPSTRPPGSPSR